MITAALVVLALQAGPDIVLPAPTGRFAVGVELYAWTDSARMDSMMDPPARRVVQARVGTPHGRPTESLRRTPSISIGGPATGLPFMPGSAPTLIEAPGSSRARHGRQSSCSRRGAPPPRSTTPAWPRTSPAMGISWLAWIAGIIRRWYCRMGRCPRSGFPRCHRVRIPTASTRPRNR